MRIHRQLFAIVFTFYPFDRELGTVRYKEAHKQKKQIQQEKWQT